VREQLGLAHLAGFSHCVPSFFGRSSEAAPVLTSA
jgi:hypothetical protein